MSAKITGMVWDLQLPRMEAWILFAMADHADHEGGHVFPSQALIAWKTGYSLRQVRRVQESLKQRKILIPEGSGYRGVHHYRLDFSFVPRKPPFVTRDRKPRNQSSTEDKMTADKMSVEENPYVNKSLQTTTVKMSIEELSTTDTMTAVKMSSEDISDTPSGSTTDIFDTSHIKDARAESLDTLEPSIKEVDVLVEPAIVPPKKPKKVPASQEPGELHPTVIEAVESMVMRKFHCLAQPTKQNEDFWDSQIALVEEARIISFSRCLKEVDAYWSGNPRKLALKPDGLRRQMHRGITYAIEQAQRNLKGSPRYGQTH